MNNDNKFLEFNNFLLGYAAKGNQTQALSPIDYFFFGYILSSTNNIKGIRPVDYNENLFKKILYINDLFKNNIISLHQKLGIYQEIELNPVDNIDKLIDRAIDRQISEPSKLQKIESHEEHKLSEDYIRKLIEDEERKHKEMLKISEEYANKLLEEEKLNEEALRELKEKELEENIDCPICLSSLFTGDQDVWGLSNCQHCFHKVCLNPYLETQISQKKFPINCPMDNCKAEISNEDLMENIEKDTIEKYWDFTLKNYVDIHAEEMSWCPTADCSYAFVYDKETSVLNCPKCMKSYCLNCRVPEHKGQTCKEYQINMRVDQNDVKFFDFVKGHKFKQCTQCQFWVEKNEGCDHMTCRCGYQFCYRCGGKYQACDCLKAVNNPPPVQARYLVNPRANDLVKRGKHNKPLRKK